MTSDNYLITFEQKGARHKLCRIFYGNDGTYYVTAPYHQFEQASLFKATVNYARGSAIITAKEFIESAVFNDAEGQLKLAHHPDGFVQFSGRGVLSGRTPQGGIKGIGVMSWPLAEPASGPAFSLGMDDITGFERATGNEENVCSFKDDELALLPDPRKLAIEGYYFPPLWRRFVRRSAQGRPQLHVIHPTGAILSLEVLFPVESRGCQGFLGVELYSYPMSSTYENAFSLSGSSGNIRFNEKDEKLGDAIFCTYQALPVGRSLHWPTLSATDLRPNENNRD